MNKIKKTLYMNPRGRDQWITLKEDRKIIQLVDIQSGLIEMIPFLTKKAARDNFQEWIDNQDIRLPKSFLINTKTITTQIIKIMRKAKLTLPARYEFKDYLLYHKSMDEYSHIILEDNFTNSSIPELDYLDIAKVVAFMNSKKKHESESNATRTGIFKSLKREANI